MNDSIRSISDGAIRLGIITGAAVALLAGVYALTADRIADQQRRAQLQLIGQVLPDDLHDNELLDDIIEVRDATLLGDDRPKRIFRGRLEGQPSALAMEVTTTRGYNGVIELIVGVRYDGQVTGVRVVQHKETPGLGDGIDIDISPWIKGFDGRSLDDPDAQGWAVKRDGGIYDQFTGATITARAVVRAVRDALEYHRQHRETLYERPPLDE